MHNNWYCISVTKTCGSAGEIKCTKSSVSSAMEEIFRDEEIEELN